MRRPANKTKLFDKTIESLTKRAAVEKFPRYLVWDTGQPGLAVVVHPSGSLVFKAIYRRNNRVRWFTIGRASIIDLPEARRRAREVLVEVDKGGDPQADRAALRKRGTIDELVPAYVADRKVGRAHKRGRRTGGKSWKHVERLLRLHICPVWGKLRPAEVLDSDVEALLRKYAGKPGMQNAVRAAASSFFGWAISKKLTRVNPCETVEKNDINARDRNLSNDELPIWWKKLDEKGVKGRALQMILLTSQRPIEVCRMRAEHIEPDGWWDLPGKPDPDKRWPGTKNGLDHRVFLPRAARDLIKKMGVGNTGFVFAGPTGVGPIYALDECMREVSEDLAKQDITAAKPHDMRRTHGTNVTRLRFGVEMMDRIQNHVVPGIGSKHYDKHDYAEQKAEVMEAVAGAMMAVVEGRPQNVVRGQFKRQKR